MSLKSLIQCWVVIAVGGMIGLTAIAWNGSYQKGSPIAALHEVFDVIKTYTPKPQGVVR